VQPFTGVDLGAIKYYRFTFGKVNGVDCMIARTGYTGEDGVELYFSPEHSEKMWFDLLEAGKAQGLVPCGLGARNTLRLEAGMCLYGHEIDETTTVWEANLGWICKPDKGDFLGREALVRQKEQGITRRLVGFEMIDRLIARDSCPVLRNENTIGKVTSGSPAPFLKKNIGMAYVPLELAEAGAELRIGVRNQQGQARVVTTPFYKRPR